ncbi:MAG TPA: dTDP-glucose 4,6-dehydratase [Thermodesulfobacteriota bacterium]
MRLLVTGGAGFIGSNFVRLALGEGWAREIVVFDLLTYAGNLENLAEVERAPGFRFVRGDIADAAAVDRVMATAGPFDAVVNFAAETHVDRSIEDASAFVRTNVIGTQVLLDAARRHGVGRFLQVSTDEVYGTLAPGDSPFTEATPLAPNSPYAASKAGADLLCRAAAGTHGQHVVVTRCSNNYGPYQFPEKLIPLFVTNAIEGLPLPVYGDGLQIRDWIHVEDHCRGLYAALTRGRPGEVYNFGGDGERTNLDITRMILRLVGRDERLITHVRDRKNHDRRYAINSAKARRDLGWAPRYTLATGLPATVEWYRTHDAWWRKVKSGAYRRDHERLYRDKWLDAGS